MSGRTLGWDKCCYKYLTEPRAAAVLILFTLKNSGKGQVLLLYIVYLVELLVGAGAPPVYLVEPWV